MITVDTYRRRALSTYPKLFTHFTPYGKAPWNEMSISNACNKANNLAAYIFFGWDIKQSQARYKARRERIFYCVAGRSAYGHHPSVVCTLPSTRPHARERPLQYIGSCGRAQTTDASRVLYANEACYFHTTWAHTRHRVAPQFSICLHKLQTLMQFTCQFVRGFNSIDLETSWHRLYSSQ